MSARSLPLLLIPGLVCDSRVWRHQAEFLGEVADPRPVEVPALDTMADVAEAILADAPPRFAAAGFSMGGYVLLEMLRQAPERFERIALVDTSARADTEERAEARRGAIAACERGELESVVESMMPVLLCHRCRSGPLPDLVREMTTGIGAEAFARRHRSMLTRLDGRDPIAATAVPVRVIFGREDGMSSLEEHEEMARLAPHGHLSIIEECGHMTPIERPHAVTTLLRDWLTHDC